MVYVVNTTILTHKLLSNAPQVATVGSIQWNVQHAAAHVIFGVGVPILDCRVVCWPRITPRGLADKLDVARYRPYHQLGFFSNLWYSSRQRLTGAVGWRTWKDIWIKRGFLIGGAARPIGKFVLDIRNRTEQLPLS